MYAVLFVMQELSVEDDSFKSSSEMIGSRGIGQYLKCLNGISILVQSNSINYSSNSQDLLKRFTIGQILRQYVV